MFELRKGGTSAHPEKRKNNEQERYQSIIEEAWNARHVYTGQNHIWRALDNARITSRAERMKIYKIVKKALKEREKAEKKDKQASSRWHAFMDEYESDVFMRDAQENARIQASLHYHNKEGF